jgi:aspartyl-tRNA(Asn)/glutamyl-tRNA(Gln) amidotransferase subunit A
VDTRELFRTAAQWVAQHALDELDARPAFVSRAGEAGAVEMDLAGGVADIARAIRRGDIAAEGASRPGMDLAGGVADTARAIRHGEITAGEVVERALGRVDAHDGRLRAFVVALRERARAEAAALDRETAAGRSRGPLHGVPLSIKDVIHVAGVPTTASSRVLDDLVPAEDAAAVARLRAAGAIVIGKTETHEFALGVTTPQSRNPWDVTRIPGGSTGGSAIAIVTGMAPGALGTDTRASIRVPAALTGVVGFKPTFGLVPTHGVVTLSWSMDHCAPMAGSVADAALLLDVVAGRDPRDPGSVERPAGSHRARVGTAVRGLRVGVPAAALEGAEPDVARAFEAALDGLRSLDVRVETIAEPGAADLEMANAAGMVVSRCEAATLHRRFLAERAARYTPETLAQLDEAARLPAALYLAAQRLREEFRLRMGRLLGRVHALALPTTPVTAPRVADAERFLLVLARNCIPWSFIGVPALSLPCGRSRAGLPIGLQLVAPAFEDGRLVALGSAVETLGLWKPELCLNPA